MGVEMFFAWVYFISFFCFGFMYKFFLGGGGEGGKKYEYGVRRQTFYGNQHVKKVKQQMLVQAVTESLTKPNKT
jgi:hypothetical protein